MSKSPQIWIRVGLVTLMGAVFFFGFLQHPSSFDDAYITYRYARNIALGRGFVYNAGEPVLGTTTPLYTLLLAGLSLAWQDIPLVSHFIGVLAWMLCVPVVYGIGRAGGSKLVGIVAATLVATSALFLDVLGMETALYVLLALSTFYFYLDHQHSLAALCAGLTFVMRWDGILVVGVFLLAEGLEERWGKRFISVTLICAFIMLPWLVYSQLTFGSIFPNTFFAKTGQGWNPGLGGSDIGSFVEGLLRVASSAYSENLLFLFWPVFATVGLLVLVFCRVRWWVVLLWTLAYIVGYLALGVQRFHWYYPPLIPGLSLLVAQGIETVAQFMSRLLARSKGRTAIAALLCALCLVPNLDWLLRSRRAEADAHTASYLQVGEWLQANTPEDSSVALLEIGIIGFYSDRPVVDTMGLISPGMVGHLDSWLQTLEFAVNYYWPDYVVALERTAWTSVIQEPWFQNAYSLEMEFENDADPVAPIRIYRRREEFPRSAFALHSPQRVSVDQAAVLQEIRVAENRLMPGEDLYVQLTWEAMADTQADYRLHFDLVNTLDSQAWTLASDLQPMQGGNPTYQWRTGDGIVDMHLLNVPADVSAGFYRLQLVVTDGESPVPLTTPAGNRADTASAEPIQIGAELEVAQNPSNPLRVVFDDNIVLSGYDLQCTNAMMNLSLTLFWEGTAEVSTDYTVFVQMLSPEGQVAAQSDSPPLVPTSLWVPGTQYVDMHTVSLESAREPSEYLVIVGLYHWQDLGRVPVADSDGLETADDAVLLGSFHPNSSSDGDSPNCPELETIER